MSSRNNLFILAPWFGLAALTALEFMSSTVYGVLPPAASTQELAALDDQSGPVDDLFIEDPPPGEQDEPAGLDRSPSDRPSRRGRGPRDGRSGRPPHEMGGEGPGRFSPGPPPEEMIERAMRILRAKLPAEHARMEKLQRRNPERFMLAIQRLMPIVMEYVSLRDENPELAETIFEEFKIEERLRRLSREFRDAKDEPEDQARLGQEIERLVREQFEMRMRRQLARLEEFERRLREQQARLEEQRAYFEEELKRRDDVVARRVQEVKDGKAGDPPRPEGLRLRGPDGGMRGPPHRGPGGPGGPGGPHRPPPGPRDDGPPPPPPDQPPPPSEEGDEPDEPEDDK